MHKDRNELSCCQMDNLCAHESFLLDLHHHHRGNICTPSFIQEWMQKKKKNSLKHLKHSSDLKMRSVQISCCRYKLLWM